MLRVQGQHGQHSFTLKKRKEKRDMGNREAALLFSIVLERLSSLIRWGDKGLIKEDGNESLIKESGKKENCPYSLTWLSVEKKEIFQKTNRNIVRNVSFTKSWDGTNTKISHTDEQEAHTYNVSIWEAKKEDHC